MFPQDSQISIRHQSLFNHLGVCLISASGGDFGSLFCTFPHRARSPRLRARALTAAAELGCAWTQRGLGAHVLPVAT